MPDKKAAGTKPAAKRTEGRRSSGLVIAKKSFAAPDRRVSKDTLLDADDPLVKRYPGLFEPVENRMRTTRKS